MKCEVLQTDEFERWYKKQTLKIKALISDRIERLKEYGHMGNSRAIETNLFEFKWKIGLRIYFCFQGKKIVLLLNGGKKNAQKKDIERAKRLKKKYS